MNDLKEVLVNMQEAINSINIRMSELKEDIINTINKKIDDKFDDLNIKNEYLEKRLEEQSLKINHLEKHIRRKNLVLFGIEETEKSYHELEATIINMIITFFKVPCDTNNIEAVRRLGKKGERVRPVVITFTTMGFKIKIQNLKQCLLNTPYYIKEDYPREVLIKRKELQVQLQKEKEAGNIAFIKYDKLIVLNNREHTSRNQTNKRNLSESPETSHLSNQTVQNSNKKQPLKKNKSTNMKDYVLHKPKPTYSHAENSQKQTKTTQFNAV